MTESTPPVQFKMEPYETHSLIDETGDETFGDDTLDDNTVDDTEDYSMMEGGVGEEEPQAGTSTDGAGEGQGRWFLLKYYFWFLLVNVTKVGNTLDYQCICYRKVISNGVKFHIKEKLDSKYVF